MTPTQSLPLEHPHPDRIARALRRMLAKLYRPDLAPVQHANANLSRAGAGAGPISCPSSTAELGAHEIGVVGDDGRVIFHEVPVPISPRPAGSRPEATSRLGASSATLTQRFSGPCKQSRCHHWDGFCRLGVAAARAAFELEASTAPASCPISDTCRWRLENGSSACVVCPWVHRIEPEQLIAIHEGARS